MSKKNLILLLVLALLLGLSAVYQLWWLPRVNNASREKNFLADINFKQVDKIIVKRGETATTLIRDGQRFKVQTAGDWQVNNLLTEAMNQAWQTAAGNPLFLVSQNKAAQADFKTDGSGLTVKFFQSDRQVGEWRLGLTRADYTYLSLPDSEATYEVKGDLRSAFDYAEWRDMVIWTAPAEITKLTIKRGRQTINLVKENDSWLLVSDKKIKLKQDRVAQIASLMTNLSASSLPGAKETATGLDKSALIIEAGGQNLKRVLTVGQAKSADEVYVRTDQNNNVYLIRKEQIDILNVGLSDLRG